jgi:hypothetical protein
MKGFLLTILIALAVCSITTKKTQTTVDATSDAVAPTCTKTSCPIPGLDATTSNSDVKDVVPCSESSNGQSSFY